MKNKDFGENKFYIPFPDLTFRQEKWACAVGTFIIVFLIGVIAFLMYVTENPDIIFDRIQSLSATQTTVADTTAYTPQPQKEHTTAYKGHYVGGIYEPMEEPETTAMTTTQKNNESIITGNETTTVTEPMGTTTITTTTEPTTILMEESTTTQKPMETTTLTEEVAK